MRNTPSHCPHGCVDGTQVSRVGSAGGSRGRAAHVPSTVPTHVTTPPPGAGTGHAGEEGGAVPRLGSHALCRHGTAGGCTIGMGLTSPRCGSLARAPAALKLPFVPGQPLALGIQVMPGGERGRNQATESLAVPASTGQMPLAQQGGWAQRAPGRHGGHCQSPPAPPAKVRPRAVARQEAPEEEGVPPTWPWSPLRSLAPQIPSSWPRDCPVPDAVPLSLLGLGVCLAPPPPTALLPTCRQLRPASSCHV